MDRAQPHRERGQATVEVVLVLPLIITLVLAVGQIGLIARDRLLVVHAAREAARAAAVDPRPDTARAAAASATGLDEHRLSVELGPDRDAGDRLTVTVRYRVPTNVPLIGPLLPDVEVHDAMTVRVE